MATLLDLADVGDLTAEQDDLAARIEAALERAGRRGLTASAAARLVRCTTTEQARPVLAYLIAHQYAHTDRPGGRARPYSRRKL